MPLTIHSNGNKTNVHTTLLLNRYVKDMAKTNKASYFFILFLALLLALLLRTIWLDRIPMGMSDDELDYVLTAQSISYTGKNLNGTFKPFSFQSVSPDTQIPYARAPYMIMAPIYRLIGTRHELARLPYALISVLTILILVGITQYLFGNTISLYVAYVAALNPWSIYFGRTAFEAPLAVFFAYVFLLSILYLRSWWITLSIIPWLLGFYSYQGTNIIYPLLLGIGIPYAFFTNKLKNIGQYALVSILACIFFLFFLIGIKNSNAVRRIDEIINPNSTSIITSVNAERKNSIQNSYNVIFSNRFIVFSREFIGKYLGAFSTNNLFITGEGRSTFSMWTHGWFYYLDFIFLLIGLYAVFLKNKRNAFLLLSIILIAPIPSALSVVGSSYALRASLMFPSFCIIIGVGIHYVIQKFKNQFFRAAMGIIYLFMVTNFLHTYFIRNPVNNSEGFGLSNRILSSYIRNSDSAHKQVLFIGSGALNIYRQYLFWTDSIQSTSVSSIQNSIQQQNFHINNVVFVECGDVPPEGLTTKIVITQSEKPCPILDELKRSSEVKTISQLADSGRVYDIYNDQLCNLQDLSPYQSLISSSDMNIEKLQIYRFCQTYISKPINQNKPL